MIDCIFCKIAAHDIPSEIIYEDDEIFFFEDISPQAPVHFLGIPKKHIASISELDENDTNLICKILLKIRDIVKDYPELNKGYRVVINTGKESGQTVRHLHFHIIGGRHMGWPPG